jgi:hypothetical protein
MVTSAWTKEGDEMPRVTDPAATTMTNFAQIRREHNGVFFDAPALISRWRVTIVGQAEAP